MVKIIKDELAIAILNFFKDKNLRIRVYNTDGTLNFFDVEAEEIAALELTKFIRNTAKMVIAEEQSGGLKKYYS